MNILSAYITEKFYIPNFVDIFYKKNILFAVDSCTIKNLYMANIFIKCNNVLK